jgi:hypothetical protein
MPILDYLVQNGSSTGQFSGMPDSIVFLVATGSRSELTDHVKRLTSRHPDRRQYGSNGANRVSWNCFPIARHSDDIHFGQGRASRIRFSWEISNQESEHASVRLGFEERQHVIVFQRESADKYRDDASDVERWRETSVSTRADALGAFLALAWTIFRATLK